MVYLSNNCNTVHVKRGAMTSSETVNLESFVRSIDTLNEGNHFNETWANAYIMKPLLPYDVILRLSSLVLLWFLLMIMMLMMMIMLLLLLLNLNLSVDNCNWASFKKWNSVVMDTTVNYGRQLGAKGSL